MSDAQTIAVPEEIRKAFGPLVELILGSQSMNEEERRYWINTLPVMKPEQLTSLTDILTREKEQLAAIDKKYAHVLSKADERQAVAAMGKERTQKREEREMTEEQHESEERRKEAEILRKIEEH